MKVIVKTFGCQMNAYDTEVASGLLKHQGYDVIHEHEGDENPIPLGQNEKGPEWYKPNADVVIMNTCSVREHAEDRVYSRLGMLNIAKKTNPDLIVGLMGCMVEEHRERLFKRFPQIDLMVGTRNIRELPDLIDQVRNRRTQVSSIKQDGISIEYTDQIQRVGKYHAWLPVMTGCNKVCTFCIVPITRGSEVSMKARDVYREAVRLVDQGVQWITLLGQNVNSYHGEEEGREQVHFAELLNTLAQVEGLHRISFTTSHPHDATEDLYDVIQKNPKISRRFHLPLQSGSNAVLKRMKRLHTYEEYREKIEKMRSMIPDVAITTDIISGFSGETEKDHEATARALEEIRYDGAYIYKYSVRPATPAAKLPDDVSLLVKEERNRELLKIQKKITSEVNQSWVGRTTNAFFELDRLQNRGQIIGRTDQEKRVAVQGTTELLGNFKKVRLDELKNETFLATILPS